MAVKIRLQRHGSKHRPFYRLVVADSRSKRDGRFVEIIGTYNPQTSEQGKDLAVKLDRADYWLGVGAQPSDTARSLINRFRRENSAESSEETEAKVTPAAPAEAEAVEEPKAEVAKDEESEEPVEAEAAEAPEAKIEEAGEPADSDAEQKE